MSGAAAPYRSRLPAGREGFLQLLHAEWTKFRTVRGWVIAAAVGALLIVLIAVFTGAASHSRICVPGGVGGSSPHHVTCRTSHPQVPLGPGGEPVTDRFYFVHRRLAREGSITVRLRSLTGKFSPKGVVKASGRPAGIVSGVQPWSKAGVILKESLTQGSRYAAVMVTGTHGVRMQYDYTHDIAGIPGAASESSPRWLRLARSGDTLTGYDSTDGRHWTDIGVAHLAALPATVQVGLFAASPDSELTSRHLGGSSSKDVPTLATGVFDHVSLQGEEPGDRWSADQVGGGAQGLPQGRVGFAGHAGFRAADGSVTIAAGSGDIAPAVSGGGDPGQGIERTLVGAFVGLIVLTVLATLFVTAEYRRGLIRTTFAASPRRGRVLAAKALVIAAVTFVAGFAGAALALPLGAHLLRSNGNYIYPPGTRTELRVIVGTAALLAVAAVLALSAGAILRRSAGAVTAVIASIVVPYLLAVASVLPTGAAQWLLRLTPAAAFAVQQSVIQYHQVTADYTPANGFFPLSPLAGFAILCGYTACVLALAAFLLGRRDA